MIKRLFRFGINTEAKKEVKINKNKVINFAAEQFQELIRRNLNIPITLYHL